MKLIAKKPNDLKGMQTSEGDFKVVGRFFTTFLLERDRN